MTKKIVTVQFIYEGVSYPTDYCKGVLLPDNKVFISDKEGQGIYESKPTSEPNKYIVDLDKNDTDYLTDRPELLLALIAG